MNAGSFIKQIDRCAEYLISRRNPADGGWGLNIEKGFQASSIVNTTEALVSISASRRDLPNLELTINFLRDAVVSHPENRGDNLRFYTFGIWGLLEAGVPVSDPDVQKLARAIQDRYVEELGWSEQVDDPDVRLWQTFQSLWMLTKVYGRSHVASRYHNCVESILDSGRRNSFQWGFSKDLPVSLGATAYASMILSIIYPGSPYALEAKQSVTALLNAAMDANRMIEVEPIPGTDWNHYSCCWAMHALYAVPSAIDKATFQVSLRMLRSIASLYDEKRAYLEPGKNICNVRSIFNNVLALRQMIASFDPWFYLQVEEILAPIGAEPSQSFEKSGAKTPPTMEKSVFVSFSFQPHDKELGIVLQRILAGAGYKVYTGEGNRIGSVSQSILEKIRKSDKVLIVITKRDEKPSGKYTTSSWLNEEKGAAIALGKPLLMLIEEGVDELEVGGLHGDSQRIAFSKGTFASAVADAMEMLKRE